MRTYCLRRVYDSLNCSVNDSDPATWTGFSQPFGAIVVEVGVNMAPKPEIPLPVGGDRNIVRGRDNVLQMALHRSLENTPLTGPITEIICWADDVDEATDELRALCRAAIDLFALAIGLSSSRQFFAVEHGEDEWRRLPSGQWQATVARPLALIEDPSPTHDEVRERALDLITGRPLNPSVVERSILPWLLRAWREHDLTSRFVSLFIPLEMLLQGHSAPSRLDEADLERIRAAVTESCGDDAGRLNGLVDAMARRMGPSLADRFAAMAQSLDLETAESDVAAFRKFNKMRNALLHLGDAAVRTEVTVGQSDVVRLQDLTERYVLACLFAAEQ